MLLLSIAPSDLEVNFRCFVNTQVLQTSKPPELLLLQLEIEILLTAVLFLSKGSKTANDTTKTKYVSCDCSLKF